MSICYEAVAAKFPSYFTSIPLPSSQHMPSKPARHQRRRDPANGSHGDEDKEDGGRKVGVIKEKKVMWRKNRRRYRPPTSRTINSVSYILWLYLVTNDVMIVTIFSSMLHCYY